MLKQRWLAALAAICLAASSLSTQSRSAGTLHWIRTKVETTEGRKQSVDAEEGRLRVDADPDHPTGRFIELRLVRFKATPPRPGPPLVYLAGGPGGSGVLSAAGDRFPLFQSLRAAGDVIALDQRGVRSEPFPSCRTPFRLAFGSPLSLESLLEAYGPASKACAERWTSQIDLRVFNTWNSAADLETLRAALGVPKINLLAISYGTHLALATLKRYPALAERVVLAGVEGPDHTLKLPSEADDHFAKIAALLKTDAAARAAVPDLRAVVEQALTRLRSAPATLQARAPDGTSHPVTVGPHDLLLSLWETIQERDDIAALPARAAKVARGDYTPVAEWAVARRSVPGLSSMMFTTDCASGASEERLARIAREAPAALFGDLVNWPFPAICASWPHVDLGPSFRAPVTSSVPTLFLSGALDGRTPASNALEVSKGFSTASVVTIDNGGHDDDLLIASPAIGDTIQAFLQGRPPAAERITLPPIRFRTR